MFLCDFSTLKKADFAYHWSQRHDFVYLSQRKPGRPSTKPNLKCPDCFCKVGSIETLNRHLDLGCDVGKPPPRKRGRPVKYHPIPSQKLTDDFQIPVTPIFKKARAEDPTWTPALTIAKVKPKGLFYIEQLLPETHLFFDITIVCRSAGHRTKQKDGKKR